jgi:hypothetical protein
VCGLKNLKTKPKISFTFDKTKVWPAINDVNANLWIIGKIDGKWHGGTFDWLRPGGCTKDRKAVGASALHGKMSNWNPADGEKVYFLVTTLARDGRRNGNERTNIVEAVW